MEVKKYKELTGEEWNGYLSAVAGVPFAYTAKSIEFQTTYAQSVFENASFLLVQDQKPVAVVVIYLDRDEKGVCSISWGGRSCPAPFISQAVPYHLQEKYLSEAMKEIEIIESQYQVEKTMFQMEPLANALQRDTLMNYQFLLKYGYKDTSYITQMLDLRKEEKELWSDVRKGHKSDIKKGRYDIVFYDFSNITKDHIECYRSIYEQDAGMVTRNSELYMHYYDFVKAGKGLLAFAYKNGKPVAVLIVTGFGNMAYYSSYAELSEELDGPVGHQLQWETILELKRRKIAFYEVGEQVFGTFPKGSEEAKLVNISMFKRGFGGYPMMKFCGVKQVKACTQQ